MNFKRKKPSKTSNREISWGTPKDRQTKRSKYKYEVTAIVKNGETK